MRDCGAKQDTSLHRAAAFGSETSIDMLLKAGALRETEDMHGDTPLSWASWYLRPRSILRKLCYGPYSVHLTGS
ncbi:MAG: ankyrin repeat domain-containing protein [Proteobacteria bacterium]|nr:ankyrin repeat domain-containing protein [Pseudomonadota bacterium]